MEARLATPFGHVVIIAHEGKVNQVHLRPEAAATAVPPKFPQRVLQPLRDYFDGKALTPDVPFQVGGTEFQRAVWQALRRVPPGRPTTYGEHALRIGRPGAFRAVGQALRINPLPIIWPCHRVVASGGKLGGFGGSSDPDDPAHQGQLRIKEWLLAHEAQVTGVQTRLTP